MSHKGKVISAGQEISEPVTREPVPDERWLQEGAPLDTQQNNAEGFHPGVGQGQERRGGHMHSGYFYSVQDGGEHGGPAVTTVASLLAW